MKIVELSPQDFDVYAKEHEYANPWQTSNFGRAAETLGYGVMYLGFEDGSIKGVTLLLTKNVYLGQSVSYAPRGPLLDYQDYNLLENAFVSLKKYLNNNKIMSFTMDPTVILAIRNKYGAYKQINNGVDKRLDEIMNGGEIVKANPYAKDIVNFLLKKMEFDYLGQNLFFEGILPRWYAVTNLPVNPKTLLTKIDKRARTKLRKAIKLGVEIIKDETKNVEYIYNIAKEKFNRPIEYYVNLINNNPDCEVYLARVNSEKYVNNSKILYERELERNELLDRVIQQKNIEGKSNRKAINQKMESDRIINNFKEHLVNSTQILKDYPNGRVIAFCIVIKDKNNVTIFEDGYVKELSNLNALYLLRWKIIEQYSNNTLRTFIFGEVTGGFDIMRNPLHGLNEAKLAYRGNIMEYIGEFGIMTNKAMYNLYQATSGGKQVFKL